MSEKKNKNSDSFIVTMQNGDPHLLDTSILQQYAIKADTDSEGSKQIHSDGWNWNYNQFLEPLYDPERLCRLLELNTYHASCVEAVAIDSSGDNWTLNPKSDVFTTEEPPKDVIEFLNGVEQLNTVLQKRIYDRRAMGYGAIEIVRESTSDSKPINLVHIPAHTLRRHRDQFRVQQKIGTHEVWFVIYGKNYHPETGELVDVDADTGDIHPYNTLPPEQRANELLWTQEYTPKSQYYGMPPVIKSLSAIHGDYSRASYNSAFFANFGVPAFAVTIVGDFQDYDVEPTIEVENSKGELVTIENPNYDVTQTLKYKISQQLKEVIQNPHSALCITIPSEGEEGNVEVKLQPLSVETKEASFRLFRQDNRDEVLNAHGVPPYRIGINETGNLGGTNINRADSIYGEKKIRPIIRDNENDINRLLINEFECTDWVFTLPELGEKDYANDIALAEKLFNMAAMTPRDLVNNFGEKFGLKIPANQLYMDTYFLNGVPIEQVFTQTVSGSSILDNLEDSLMEDATIYDDNEQGEEELPHNDGIKNTANKENPFSLARTIQNAFNFRN